MAGRILLAALAAMWGAQAAPGSFCRAADSEKPLAELRQELIAWRNVLQTRDAARTEERAFAMDSLRGISDPRAVPILFELWEKENHRDGSYLTRGHLIEGLIKIGDRPAFLKLAEVSVEDLSRDNRQRAASWIGAQDNRDDAIPIYTKALKSTALFHNALSALGYAQIATKGKQPPDRDLVAALIGNLITVTPVRRRVPFTYDTGWRREYPSGQQRTQINRWVWVTELESSENEAVKNLLYEYCFQDYGFDQKAWRENVLKRLPRSSNTGKSSGARVHLEKEPNNESEE
jgi:hypothetical protein